MTEQWSPGVERTVTWTCDLCGAPIAPEAPMEYRPIYEGESPSFHNGKRAFPPLVIVRHVGGMCSGWFVAAFPRIIG